MGCTVHVRLMDRGSCVVCGPRVDDLLVKCSSPFVTSYTVFRVNSLLVSYTSHAVLALAYVPCVALSSLRSLVVSRWSQAVRLLCGP